MGWRKPSSRLSSSHLWLGCGHLVRPWIEPPEVDNRCSFSCDIILALEGGGLSDLFSPESLLFILFFSLENSTFLDSRKMSSQPPAHSEGINNPDNVTGPNKYFLHSRAHGDEESLHEESSTRSPSPSPDRRDDRIMELEENIRQL